MSAIGPGDLVECIDASPSAYPWDSGRLDLGRIYTVELILAPEDMVLPSDEPGVILVEPCTKEWDAEGREGAWRLSRFRPVRRPNIESLKALQTPAPAPVNERTLEDA